MKKDLVNLISQTEHISTLFTLDETYYCESIYFNYEFIKWKSDLFTELNEIKFKDALIETALEYITAEWTGLNDKRLFTDLSDSLTSVLKDIDKYYTSDEALANTRKTKIFISYHDNDFDSVKTILSNLKYIKDDIVYNLDSLDNLVELNKEFDLFVIYVLSSNYLDSIKCQNEMGATWVLKSDYVAFNVDDTNPSSFHIKTNISDLNDINCFSKLTELF